MLLTIYFSVQPLNKLMTQLYLILLSKPSLPPVTEIFSYPKSTGCAVNSVDVDPNLRVKRDHTKNMVNAAAIAPQPVPKSKATKMSKISFALRWKELLPF